MSPVVRFLRIALPIAFVAFVIVIIASFTGGRPKSKTVSKAPVIAPRKGEDKPKLIADAFCDTQSLAGRVTMKICAKRVIGFQSGWHRLEDVHLTVFRNNGQSYDISSTEAEVNAETKEAEARGGVKVVSSDGVELQTDSIRYDGKKLANKIPVRFKIDEWTGHAGGIDLDVPKETLSLNDGFEADLQPTRPDEPPMHLAAKSSVFQRTTGDVSFNDQVVLTRAADAVHSDKVQARLTPGLKKIAGFEGSGHVVMTLAQSSALTQGAAAANQIGSTRVTADRFYTESYSPGKIDSVVIVGESGPAVANMQGPPSRNLTAKQFKVVLDGANLKELQSTGDTVMVENDGASQRRVTADVAVTYFDPASRKPINLYMQDNISYADGKVDAKGDRANYEFATRKLVLSALPGKAPTLRTESETLRANTLEVLVAEQLLKANGAVFAELKQKAGASTGSSAIFPDKAPVNVNADIALLNRATKTGQFNGNVRAWQGTNTIFADQMQVAADAETLTATGNVRGSMTNVVKPSGNSPVLTRSDSLVAKRRERRIDLDGNVRVDDNGRVLQSEKATAFLDARNKIDHIDASGKLNITERATGRKGTGEHATYKLAQKAIRVDGNPATMADPKGTISGSQIVFDIDKNRVDVISGTTPTEATYNPQ